MQSESTPIKQKEIDDLGNLLNPKPVKSYYQKSSEALTLFFSSAAIYLKLGIQPQPVSYNVEGIDTDLDKFDKMMEAILSMDYGPIVPTETSTRRP